MLTTLPNILTMSRIAVIPLVVAAFYLPQPYAAWFSCGLFALACVTDWLDGHFARRWSQFSAFGRFLDPIADKLLVSITLMMLVAFDRLNLPELLPALIILAREILVSGLREFLADLRVGLPVSRLAKWKTGIQMLAIGGILLGNYGPWNLPYLKLGEVLLWVAAILTLVTGYDYLRAGLKHMAVEPTPVPPAAAPRPAAPLSEREAAGGVG
jgi:cardiolipin synthase